MEENMDFFPKSTLKLRLSVINFFPSPINSSIVAEDSKLIPSRFNTILTVAQKYPSPF